MKDLLADVIALQDVEVEVFKAQGNLDGIPKEIEEIESIILARKRSLDAVDEELADLGGRKAPLEKELEENQVILDAADARIKKIKTNKEYLALQREIDIAKKRKSDIEEQILTLMDKIERRALERESIQKTFEADSALLDERRGQLQERLIELTAQKERLQRECEELRKTVDASLLSKYDRIKKNKRGLVVVECIDGVCMGCNMHIPPQLFNELVRGDTLIICPLCQRILYT